MATAAQTNLSQCPISFNDPSFQGEVSFRSTMNAPPELHKVILASVTNMTYSVDLDTLHQLFTRFGGPIDKIVSFSKNPLMYQALIQFRDESDAKKAMAALHNRNMYEGCNTLQISPSKLPEITVKANDRTKSWDFTIEPSIPGPAPLPTYIGGNQVQSPGQPGNMQQPSGMQGGMGGDPMQMGQFPGMQQQMFQQMQQMQHTGSPGFIGAAGGDASGAMFSHNPVLICYNLEPTQMTAQRLFNLMCLYGIVTKVKILREKPDTALVQFSHPGYSQLAKTNLNDVVIFGRPMSLAHSKNADVKLPQPKPTDNAEEFARMQHEFSQREQRHKPDEGEKFQKSSPPTSTVFVANIPEDSTKDEIFRLFATFGQITDMTINPSKNASKKQMSVLAMNSTADAIACVACLHDYDLKGCHLKVSFSRAQLRPQP